MISTHKNLAAIGIDVVEIKRIKNILNNKTGRRSKIFFTEKETAYYSSHSNKAPHFAGIFAAKEAISKALGVKKYPFTQIEIRHNKNGAPVPYFKNKKLQVTVSITHTKDLAIAIAAA